MKFGPANPADAIGGVTVHTLRQGSLVLKKGTTIGRPAKLAARVAASCSREPSEITSCASRCSAAAAMVEKMNSRRFWSVPMEA